MNILLDGWGNIEVNDAVQVLEVDSSSGGELRSERLAVFVDCNENVNAAAVELLQNVDAGGNRKLGVKNRRLDAKALEEKAEAVAACGGVDKEEKAAPNAPVLDERVEDFELAKVGDL